MAAVSTTPGKTKENIEYLEATVDYMEESAQGSHPEIDSLRKEVGELLEQPEKANQVSGTDKDGKPQTAIEALMDKVEAMLESPTAASMDPTMREGLAAGIRMARGESSAETSVEAETTLATDDSIPVVSHMPEPEGKPTLQHEVKVPTPHGDNDDKEPAKEQPAAKKGGYDVEANQEFQQGQIDKKLSVLGDDSKDNPYVDEEVALKREILERLKEESALAVEDGTVADKGGRMEKIRQDLAKISSGDLDVDDLKKLNENGEARLAQRETELETDKSDTVTPGSDKEPSPEKMVKVDGAAKEEGTVATEKDTKEKEDAPEAAIKGEAKASVSVSAEPELMDDPMAAALAEFRNERPRMTEIKAGAEEVPEKQYGTVNIAAGVELGGEGKLEGAGVSVPQDGKMHIALGMEAGGLGSLSGGEDVSESSGPSPAHGGGQNRPGESVAHR